ncbi:MAG TPA: DUF4344 domain-containing metallopeptidase [Pyrinomonadaceae bacterium]
MDKHISTSGSVFAKGDPGLLRSLGKAALNTRSAWWLTNAGKISRLLVSSAPMRRRQEQVRFCALFLAALLSLGETAGLCGTLSQNRGAENEGKVARSPSLPEVAIVTTSRSTGEFKFRADSIRRLRSRSRTTRLKANEQLLRQIVADLNEQITLPRDIEIAFADCYVPESAYDHHDHRITICHELIDDFYQLFYQEFGRRANINQRVEGTMAALLLHEVAHALIDALNLPITGREEDAADQLSTLLLINRTADGERMALDVARALKLLAKHEKPGHADYWDEHSLDVQRFYDTVCLVYGSNTRRYSYLISNKTLPEGRAVLCGKQYARVKNSWMKLLEPYVKGSLWTRQ